MHVKIVLVIALSKQMAQHATHVQQINNQKQTIQHVKIQ
jgi:hypothetical protein